MECLTLAKLLNYLQNPVYNRENARINAHLSSGCQVCNENLQWFETIISLTAQDQSFEFSEETIAVIVAQFKERTEAVIQPIRQYIARLIYDNRLLPQLADARSTSAVAAGAVAAGRQALYRSEGYDIDLRFKSVEETDDELLVGQVLPELGDATELMQFKVQLLQHGSVV